MTHETEVGWYDGAGDGRQRKNVSERGDTWVAEGSRA